MYTHRVFISARAHFCRACFKYLLIYFTIWSTFFLFWAKDSHHTFGYIIISIFNFPFLWSQPKSYFQLKYTQTKGPILIILYQILQKVSNIQEWETVMNTLYNDILTHWWVVCYCWVGKVVVVWGRILIHYFVVQ